MNQSLRIKLVITVAAVVLTVSMAAKPGEPDLSKMLRGVSASKMGVTNDGQLWGWNPTETRVSLFDASGVALEIILPEPAISVDVDRIRGIAALSSGGAVLSIYSWDGKLAETLTLAELSGDITWLEGRQVAVTPKFGEYRVEIWDLDKGTAISRLGATPLVVRPTTGAMLARTTHVRYLLSRRELFVVDAFTGTILVLSLDGRELRSGHAASGQSPEMLQWLRDTDAVARKEGTSQAPAIWHYPTVSTDEDGALWLVEHRTASTVSLYKFSRDAKVERRTIPTTCTSPSMAVWKSKVILFSDPRVERDGCPAVVESARANVK